MNDVVLLCIMYIIHNLVADQICLWSEIFSQFFIRTINLPVQQLSDNLEKIAGPRLGHKNGSSIYSLRLSSLAWYLYSFAHKSNPTLSTSTFSVSTYLHCSPTTTFPFRHKRRDQKQATTNKQLKPTRRHIKPKIPSQEISTMAHSSNQSAISGEVVTLHETDIIVGRGMLRASHPGNKR